MLSLFLLVASLLRASVFTADGQLAEAPYVRRAQGADLECITLLKITEYESGPPDSEWHCQILQRSPAANGMRGMIVEISDIAKVPKDIIDEFESAETLLIVPGGGISAEGGLQIPKGASLRVEKITSTRAKDSLRKIQVTRESRKVLAIRVKAGPDYMSEANATELSDSVFGTYGDPVNLVSQFDACSFGKLTFSPVTMLNPGDPDLDAIGVYEVQVGNITDNNLLRQAIIAQLNADWPNSTLPEILGTADQSGNVPFNHMMMCMPQETKGMGVAYAYANSWLSVYKNKWCEYLSTQMHEIGHNLGLGHSGETWNPYGDQSGFMGGSYPSDDKPMMCFNAAKSWQLDFYADKTRTVVPSVFSTSWSGRLGGIVDFNHKDTSLVLVKMETSLFRDYYINFNRMAGFNKETKEGGDHVLITAQDGNGIANSNSWLQAILAEGESYEIKDFGGVPLYSVIVTVTEINTAADPAYADILITDRQGIYVNCGGKDLYDGTNMWENDERFVNTGRKHTTRASIADTSSALEALFQSERYDIGSAPNLIYKFESISMGYYDIIFYFAEIYAEAFGTDKRVFDVRVQDTLALENVDIFDAVGSGNKAYIQTVKNMFVNDTLAIEFVAVKQNPKISALQVRPSPGVYINAGGPDFHDGTRVWKGDTGYHDVGTEVRVTSEAISGTDIPTIYQSQRVGQGANKPSPHMTYSIPLARGVYEIKLHFAEIQDTVFTNQCVFDVALEGTIQFDNVDVYKDAGYERFKALILQVKQFSVTDGYLDIQFYSIKLKPQLSAIEIVPSKPLVHAFWRYCLDDGTCRFYVAHSNSDTWEVTSMTFDWPVLTGRGILPTYLYVIRTGSAILWKHFKGEPLPESGYTVSTWEPGTIDERQIEGNGRKEYIVQFNKGSLASLDVSNYDVQLTLRSLNSGEEITVAVEQGGPDFVVLSPPV